MADQDDLERILKEARANMTHEERQTEALEAILRQTTDMAVKIGKMEQHLNSIAVNTEPRPNLGSSYRP